MKNFLQKALAWLVTFFMMIGGLFTGSNKLDTIKDYTDRVQSVEVFGNTMETAVPQTEIYRLVKSHFESALPAGKTQKKVLVLGYDGCRADLFALLGDAQNSAVRTLVNGGGQAVLSYCGGVNYPAINTQATSTAPGWCSMLTGEWANVHGIKDNGIEKSNDHLTMLTTLVEEKTIADSAFYVSWSGHFSRPGTTYWREKQYVEQKNLPVNFCGASDDDGTIKNVLTDLEKTDCSDFIFTILEYCDHAGHTTGFSVKNKFYAEAFADAEKTGKTILDAVYGRETFDTEDWLILITTDHGGYNLGHGKPSLQERMTFIIANKKVF